MLMRIGILDSFGAAHAKLHVTGVASRYHCFNGCVSTLLTHISLLLPTCECRNVASFPRINSG